MSSVPRRRKAEVAKTTHSASSGSSLPPTAGEIGSSSWGGEGPSRSTTSRSALLIWSCLLTACILCAGLFTYQLGSALIKDVPGLWQYVKTTLRKEGLPPCRIHNRNVLPSQTECTLEPYLQLLRMEWQDSVAVGKMGEEEQNEPSAEGTTSWQEGDQATTVADDRRRRDTRRQPDPDYTRRQRSVSAAEIQARIDRGRRGAAEDELAQPGSIGSSQDVAEFQAQRKKQREDLQWAEHISIVISWVNGSDPEYRKLRMQYGGRQNVGTSRDRDSGELLHALRCIQKYMPWHKGTIFLVTPGQTPSWLNTSHPQMKVIDQNLLLPEHATPTFSSNVIEQFLHLIPGLTSIFIYWNDDFFLGRPVSPSDLVGVSTGGARHPKLLMTNNPIGAGGPEAARIAADSSKKWLAMLHTTNGILNAAYGEDKKRAHLLHAPYVFYKSAFARVHAKWPKELNETTAHRFRAWNDVLMPYLHHYYVIHEGSSCCGLTYERVGVSSRMKGYYQFHVLENNYTSNAHAFAMINKESPKFFTLNDGFQNPRVGERQLAHFLTERAAGVESSFEVRQTKARL